jgi:hypothetical protein
VPATETRRILRELFAELGLPHCLKVDNGYPWGSWSDLPTDLALWLIGLGVKMHWNTPNRPQENGVIERSQGTGKRWAEPSACKSVEELQERLDQMDRIQREAYAAKGQPTRLQAYPGLKHSGKHYTQAWEKEHWDIKRVMDHLASYVVIRRIDRAGHVSIYNRAYCLGAIHANQWAQVMFDPDERIWQVANEDGHLINRLPVKEMTEENIRNLNVTRKAKRQKSQYRGGKARG